MTSRPPFPDDEVPTGVFSEVEKTSKRFAMLIADMDAAQRDTTFQFLAEVWVELTNEQRFTIWAYGELMRKANRL